MKLIVGLGNPGDKYQKTRHNVGFMVVEQFLKNFEPVEKTSWVDEKKFKSDLVEIDYSGEKLILVKPKTYMNNSGMAVQLIAAFYKIPASDIWVIHDEVDLPLGSMKIRLGGASAGHRGVTSVIETLGTDKFWRFRMGIGHPREFKMQNAKIKIKGVDDYVLGGFTGPDKGKARELIKHGAKAIAMALDEGLQAAMNRFNAK